MLLGFLIGIIVGFLISDNWLKIITWIEVTIQKLKNKKK